MLAIAPTARAADGDADGWDDTTSTPVDCNDTASDIHPHRPEDGTDDVDEDCDGSVLVRRIYTQPMNSSADSEFTFGAGATRTTSGDNLVRFSVGATATLQMVDDLPFESGAFTVVLRVAAVSGGPSTCYLKVTSTSMAETTSSFSGTGVKVLAFPNVLPGDTVTDLKVECTSGTGTVDLDWLTVQNGTYKYPPLSDVQSKSQTMGLPGVGRQSLVRASSDGAGGLGSLMFVGSDVGGFGWSDDGLKWSTANGLGQDWVDGGAYGVWEAWAVDEAPLTAQTVVVLTGDKDSADGGGLWYTDNLATTAQQWVEAPGGLGASKHIDDCGAELDYKPIGSGQLIVNEPTDTTGTRFLVASQDPDTTGLWIWDKDSGDPYYTPSAQTFNSSLPDALPSALAIDASSTWMLVGYRVIASTGVESAALYVCPADFDAATVDDCELVSSDADATWVGDVRDIEADPVQDGVFYVADGGRRWDDTSEVCEAGESTVYVVEVSGSSWPPTVTVDDTDDDAADSEPDWMDTSSGVGTQYYYGSYACNDNNATAADVYGELVPPRGTDAEGSEISTITVDPAGEWLFAFYPMADSVREYGCVRTFRTPTTEVAAGATPWLPFQGWEYNDMAFYTATPSAHAEARRAHVEVYGAFMDAEPLLEDWAGAAPHDAVFVDGGNEDPELLIGGNFLWRVLPESGALYGWNTPDSSPFDPTDTTIDEAEWELAWDGQSAVFQDATARSVAVCPGCQQVAGGVVDLMLAAGVGDYKMARLYGKVPSTARTPADRACEAHKLDSTGYDVSIWEGDETTAAQAWMTLVPQNDDDVTDPSRDRGMLFNADVTADAWCWDSMNPLVDGGIALPGYLTDLWTTSTTSGADGYYELHCQDTSYVDSVHATPAEWWDPCDTSSNPWNLADDGIGQVVSLEAIADGTALMAAAPGKQAAALGGATSGEGLWLALRDATNGISYEQIPFESGGLTYGAANCTEAEFFGWTSQAHLVFDPTSDGAGTAVAYLTSRHTDCGVVKVEFDATDPTNASSTTWTEIDTTGCDLAVVNLRGLLISRDAHWLITYGGPDSSTSAGGACAVDLSGIESPQQVVDGANLTIEIQTGLAHPHLDDTFYLGGFTTGGATHAGVIVTLERRYDPAVGQFGWGFTKLSGDDLEQRMVWDLAWGTGALGRGQQLTRLYIATAGGGFWDAGVSLE